MPIYAYRCSNVQCQHAQDVLRKISDPPLTQCTACLQDTFVKQLTSAGFALKGTGWYVTDFRENGTKKDAPTTNVPSLPSVQELAPKSVTEVVGANASATIPNITP
jgi:putative FmdB family regulatory protein